MKKNLIGFYLLFFFMQVNAQNKKIDSLKQELLVAKEDTNKVWVLTGLSENYTWSFADTALMYAQQGLQLSQELNFKSGEAYSMTDLAGALTTLGNYANALDFSYKSLTLFKSLKDPFGISYVYRRLGLCYREQGDYKQAIQYIRADLKLRELLHDDYGITVTQSMLGGIYERNNQLDSALFYAQIAYKVNQDWSGLLTVLGAIHAKLRHSELALDFYIKAIPSAIRDNFQVDILDAYNGIANVYINEGKTDSAIYYARQALAQKWGRAYPIGLLNASTLLADIYASKNKSDSTVKYLKVTINFKDSLFNQQKTREAQSFTFNEQLHQQELQQTLKQTKVQYKNRINIYILIAGLIVLLIVAVGLWRKNVYKQKSFALLQKQKQEIFIQKNKVETTLEELRSTQSQLIQSEKMASLGELTAGIAHEIQNPLNFVNNFSEINADLIDELQDELKAGKADAAISISNDIKENEQKISHHGKRADAIVKGMLQHSRSSNGVKEPTDINALADEYLRLSYHGLRAKDKDFNATMPTDFDKSIEKINIIPQDIGRVLLNLYNNAFYAVNEKNASASSAEQSYEPTVSVSTKKVGDKVLISVKDNGNGISQKVLDKIFQPFFTTKPTGQGTGLGLSLAYDIVKAHGGEIKVESKDGEGTNFTFELPV